jgi:hypothetical protein
MVTSTLSHPPGFPSDRGGTFSEDVPQAPSSRSVLSNVPLASNSETISSSGKTTGLWIFVSGYRLNKTGCIGLSKRVTLRPCEFRAAIVARDSSVAFHEN